MEKRKKILLTVLHTVLLGSTMTCMAADPPVPFGWYLEGNLGKSTLSNANYVTGGSLSNDGFGLNLNAGYKFMPYFAAEVGYTQYGKAVSKVNGTEVAKNNYYSYDVAAKGILAIGDTNANFFAKVGVARLNSKVSITNQSFVTANNVTVNTGKNRTTGYYFGLGADYSFLSNYNVNAQWQKAKGNNNTGNFELYSVGVSYIFG
ncbi:MAG: hypothetical protein ACD_60C00025G0043 [uncultured bacterium]|nr:MAG: hypothetical protein ACD_60C00025G0043 [uncultured bacterium]